MELEESVFILTKCRFSPSGGNRQTVAYHIFRDRISEFRSLIMDELKVMGEEAQAAGMKDYPKVKYQRTVPKKKADVLWD